MNTFMVKALLAVALLLATALADAEGDGPRTRARNLLKKEAAAAKLKQALLKATVPAWGASQPQPQSQSQPDDCNKTDAQWQSWRDDQIAELLKMEAIAKDVREPYLDNDSVMDRSTAIARKLDECSKMAIFPPRAVLGNFIDFVNAHRNADYQSDLTHQFGHQPDDHAYLRRVETQLTLPCLLRHPTFLEMLSNPKSYYLAWKLIERQNQDGVTEVLGCPTNGEKWTALIYRSKFLSTPDYAETFGRFFVLVKGRTDKDYDKWIQFGIWLPEDKKQRPGDYATPIHNLSVVSVARGTDPRADNRFDAIADWWRIAQDGKMDLELKFRRETPPYETDNCVRCHKTLPIGIHPAAVYEFDGNGQLTKASIAKPAPPASAPPSINPIPAEVVAELHNYIFRTPHYRRAPVYETDADDAVASPRNYGPAFGPVMARTVDSLRSCALPHRLSDRSIERVSKAMVCAHCHNGNPAAPGKFNVGLLNYPLATEKRRGRSESGTYPNLIHSRITSGVMPPDKPDEPPRKLTRHERAALYDCLSEEYFKPAPDPKQSTGLFVDWLKQKPGTPP